MKKCPKCKTIWPDETKFCGKCGMNLEQKQNVPSEKRTVTRKKSFKLKKIIIAILAFVMLITGGNFIIRSVSNSNSNPYVYLSNRKFYLVLNEKSKPIEIPVGETEDYLTSCVSFSPDKEYLYVLSDYDYETSTGDLYQCQYRKLKKNSSKNEKYCKLIATDVCSDYTPVDGDEVVYQSAEGVLYVYDGKEPKRLQKNVNRFFCTEDKNRVAVECGSYSGNYTLYIVSLSNPEETTEIVSNYGYLCPITDLNNIYYSEGFDAASSYIALAGIDREKEHLGILCDGLYLSDVSDDGMIYYEQDNEKGYSIDNMITDSRGETETLQNAREGLAFEDGSEAGLKTVSMNKDGESQTLDDKVYSDLCHYYGNTLIYASLNDFKPVDLSKIQEDENFMQNVADKIELEFLEAGIHLVSGDNKAIVTGDAARDLLTMIDNDENGMRIYMNERDVLACSDGQVVAAKIEKGKISSFELLEDVDDIIAADNEAIYYTSDKQEEDVAIYYDMNTYHNGKSKCVADHVALTLFDVYEDGKILAHTDYDDGYDLSLMDTKGEKKLIGEDTGGYIRCDKNRVLYISGNDLWLYKNGKTEYLASGVKWMWSLESMKKEVQCSYAG